MNSADLVKGMQAAARWMVQRRAWKRGEILMVVANGEDGDNINMGIVTIAEMRAAGAGGGVLGPIFRTAEDATNLITVIYSAGDGFGYETLVPEKGVTS